MAVAGNRAREPLSALRIDRICKSFASANGGVLKVLDDVSLDLGKNRIHAVLGPSGCGKTTLLHIVAGLLSSDSGAIGVDGSDIAPLRRRGYIGYMFQDDRLLPWRTSLGNVSLALEAQGIAKRERKARASEALAMVGLADFSAAYPGALSGGMRSRVALARSLVRKPEVLLMDEPFSKLDPLTRGAMHDELLRLQAAHGMAILFVTHDVGEAALLADDMTVLEPRPGRVGQRLVMNSPRPRAKTDHDVERAVRLLEASLLGLSPAIDPLAEIMRCPSP